MGRSPRKTTDRLAAGLPHFAAVPFGLIDDPMARSPYHLTVYLALRRHADFAKGDHCFPAINRLAAEARCSERKAQAVLRDLQSLGWIRVAFGTGRTHQNEYTVHLKKGCTSCTLSGKKVHHMTRKGAPRAPEQETGTKDKKTEAASPPSSFLLFRRFLPAITRNGRTVRLASKLQEQGLLDADYLQFVAKREPESGHLIVALESGQHLDAWRIVASRCAQCGISGGYHAQSCPRAKKAEGVA